MSMKMDPGVDPRPGRVPEQDQSVPRNLVSLTMALCTVFCKILRGVRVFSTGRISSPKDGSGVFSRGRGDLGPRTPLGRGRHPRGPFFYSTGPALLAPGVFNYF